MPLISPLMPVPQSVTIGYYYFQQEVKVIVIVIIFRGADVRGLIRGLLAPKMQEPLVVRDRDGRPPKRTLWEWTASMWQR